MIAEAEWTTSAPEETLALGAALGRDLQGRDVVALSGPLGSGKTLFTRGLASGLGVPGSEPVVSPTFVLVREYAGRLRLYHLDTYRLGDAEELADLGLEEMCDASDAVVVIEWADRFPELLPPEAYFIEFEHVGLTQRRVRVRRAAGLGPTLAGFATTAAPGAP